MSFCRKTPIEYYTLASVRLSDSSWVLGAQYTDKKAALQAYRAACSDCAGLRVQLCYKRVNAWLKVLCEYTSTICTECGKSYPNDDRIKAGMKCARCAY